MWLIFNTHAQMSLPCIGTGEATECAGDLSSGTDLPNLVSGGAILGTWYHLLEVIWPQLACTWLQSPPISILALE